MLFRLASPVDFPKYCLFFLLHLWWIRVTWELHEYIFPTFKHPRYASGKESDCVLQTDQIVIHERHRRVDTSFPFLVAPDYYSTVSDFWSVLSGWTRRATDGLILQLWSHKKQLYPFRPIHSRHLHAPQMFPSFYSDLWMPVVRGCTLCRAIHVGVLVPGWDLHSLGPRPQKDNSEVGNWKNVSSCRQFATTADLP